MSDVEVSSTPRKSRVEERFGETLFAGGVTCLPRLLFAHQADLLITPMEMNLILQLWTFWQERLPYPRVKTIAARMMRSRRAIQFYLHALRNPIVEEDLLACENGDIEVVERIVRPAYIRCTPRFRSDHGQSSNCYDLTPLLEALDAVVIKKRDLGFAGVRKRFLVRARIHLQRNRIRRRLNMNLLLNILRISIPKKERFLTHVDVSMSRQAGNPANTVNQHCGNQPDKQTNQPTINTTQNRNRNDARTSPGGAPGGGAINRATQPTEQQGTYGWPSSTWIETYIVDLSNQWGDHEHIPSNKSQALRLWWESALSEEDFVSMIGEARGKSNHTAVKKVKANGRPNRMPYFFKVLSNAVRVEIQAQILAGLRPKNWEEMASWTCPQEGGEP